MTEPHERIRTRISDAELERRWSAVRAAMVDRKVDAIIMQSTNDWLGGYVKWFTDLPATNGYPRTVIFYAESPMTVIEMGPFEGRRDLGATDRLHRGVGVHMTTPSFTSIAATAEYDTKLAITDMASRSLKRIGLVGAGTLPHALIKKLTAACKGKTSIVDAADLVDTIKAIKSVEEISLIREAARLQDAVFAKVVSAIKPGMRDIDVTSIAQHEGQRLGSEQGIFLGGSAKIGIRSPFVPRFMQDRTLSKGDHLSLLIEINGPGGFYTEIARTIVLGKASSELLDGFAAVRAAQDYSLSLIKPGAPPAEILERHNAWMLQHLLPPEHRLYSHGQGYDMVERPLIRHDETMPLAAGMNLAVHPGYETDSIFAVICDNYIVEANGPSTCLHATEKKIFEV